MQLQQLAQGQSDLHALFAEAPDLFCRLDADANCLELCPHWTQLTGWPTQTLQGKGWLSCLKPEETENIFQMLHRAAAQAEPTEPVEYQFRKQDGSWQTFSIRSRFHQGSCWLHCRVVSDCLTQGSQQNLQQYAQTLDGILSSSSDYIYCFDPHYRLRYVSLSGASILGYTCYEMVNKTGQELGLPGAIAARLNQQIAAVLTSRCSATYQERWLTIKGVRNFEYAVSPIHNDSNQVEAVVINARDITDSKRSERILKNLAAGTATRLGKDFFPAFVYHLTQTLDIRYAIVAQLQSDRQLKLVAAYPASEQALSPYWDITGTPCERVLKQGQYHCLEQVQQQFPQASSLGVLKAESYYGITLVDSQGQPVGLLCVLDDKPFPYSERIEQVISIFAARAGAELERQETSAALYSSEERFRRIFEASPLGMALTNLQGQFLIVNPKLCQWLGYSATELLQLNTQDITLAADYKLQMTQTQQLLAGARDRVAIEKRYTCKDGTPLWVNLIVSLINDADSSPAYLIALSQDIGDRKQKEAELRESEERFRCLFEQAAVGMDIVAPDGRYLQVNQRLCEILGYSRDELLQKKFQDVTHPDYRETDQAIFENLLAGDMPSASVEKRYICKNGEIKWVNLCTTIVHHSTGNTKYSVGVIADISDRKQAEKDLEDSRHLLQQITETSPSLVYIFDLIQQTTVYTNRDLAVVLGYCDRQISTASMDFLASTMHPEDFPQFVDYLQQLGAAADGELLSLEYRVKKADGGWVWFESVDTVFTRDEQGKVVQVIGNALDISGRKQSEAETHKALLRERELSELKSRFVSMTSHEFRTPLAVIASSAGILKDFGDRLSESRKRRHLETIQTYVQHTTQLLDDILLLNRVDSNRVDCFPAPLNLAIFCYELIEDMQLSAPGYILGLTLAEAADTSQAAEEWLVSLDAKLLRQILVNLISNGIKYSAPGCRITLGLVRDSTTVKLSVSDQGVGILPEDYEYLFESFHRGANVGTIQGTGLGLSIVKRCVDLHGGTVYFESVLLQGTTFTVCLPISPAQGGTLP
ncbi:MAG: PAS domain S-box protein [Leptolyngbyaceae cyanobacterium SM1_1_3]|nr:PAS domain S-box protein [Leptolyngbyaceae cyanobacterium SM1_1_3]